MSNEFIREARYVVLKIADVMKCLTVSELLGLRHIQTKVEEHRAEIGNPPLDCVVVESDWPEYEPTWKAIEARVTGAQPTPSVPDDIVREVLRDCCGTFHGSRHRITCEKYKGAKAPEAKS